MVFVLPSRGAVDVQRCEVRRHREGDRQRLIGLLKPPPPPLFVSVEVFVFHFALSVWCTSLSTGMWRITWTGFEMLNSWERHAGV